jgi:Predicted EndoIII-related endonuclease
MDHRAFDILSAFYPAEIRFLTEKDPFRFLISVILSAQTTDRAVNEVGKVLFSHYPDAAALSQAKLEDVEAIIRPLGFFKVKSANIIAASKLLRDGIPEEIEDLVKIPGVGRKTASCYVGDILGKPAVIVDTHFKRVANRLGYAHSDSPDAVEKEIRAEFEPALYYRASMVLNLHGRTYCHARKRECETCPVQSLCPSAL